jgi:hypothetical protein
MIYMGLTGINYYTLAVENDRDSIFTTIWKPGFNTKRVSTRNFHSKFQSINGNTDNSTASDCLPIMQKSARYRSITNTF